MPGSWSRTTEATRIHPEEEEKSESNHLQGAVKSLTGSCRKQQVRRSQRRCFSHLCDRRVLAEVEVAAEVALVADDLWQDVGVAGVVELGVLRELPHVHQAQEVPLQLVHLVRHVGVQRQDLSGRTREEDSQTLLDVWDVLFRAAPGSVSPPHCVPGKRI